MSLKRSSPPSAPAKRAKTAPPKAPKQSAPAQRVKKTVVCSIPYGQSDARSKVLGGRPPVVRLPCRGDEVGAATYPLPEAVVKVLNVAEPRPPPWPKESLLYKCWAVDTQNDRDALLQDVLQSRGWANGGNPCDPEDVNLLPGVLKGKSRKDRKPKAALYVCADDSEARIMVKCLGHRRGVCSRYRVTGFPGAEPACYKSTTARVLRGQPFLPETFVLPEDRGLLLAAARRDARDKKDSYWIGKPKNNYGGRGLVVSATAKKLADGKGVVQRYITQPLLVGGYKFHMRVYLLMTSVRPARAYVHNDMTVMFTTVPFTLAKESLGESTVHLSNYDINARPSNSERYFADKPEVGTGTLWSYPRLEAWLQRRRPDISIPALWRQLRIIGHHVATTVASYRSIKQFPSAEHQCHELFGLDVMLDDAGKCWLLECNNSPGLEYCGSHFPDGTPNPDAKENDAVTWQIMEDRLALLGIDHATTGDERNFYRVC